MSNHQPRTATTQPSVTYPRGTGRVGVDRQAQPEHPAADRSQGDDRHSGDLTHPRMQPSDLELYPPEDSRVRRRNQQLEFEEQCRYFQEIDAARRGGRPDADMIYAVPNSNVAGLKVGQKLVASGLRRGYPDINVDAPRVVNGFTYHGLRIEMKQAGGVLSDVEADQLAWHERLRDAGYKVAVCFGWREALAVTRDFLGWSG